MSNSPTAARAGRGARILTTCAAGLAVVSIGCLFAILLAPVFGVQVDAGAGWFWPVAMTVAWWGLPLSVLGIIAVVVWHVVSSHRPQ